MSIKNGSWTFEKPSNYHLDSALHCLSLAQNDCSREDLENGGRRKLFWLDGNLCRLTIQSLDTRIDVKVESRGECPAELSQAHMRALLALDDRSQLTLTSDDPLQRLPSKVKKTRFGRVFWLFEPLLQVILHQRVSGSEASKNWLQLCKKFGVKWGNIVAPPSPRKLHSLTPAEFASCGIEQKRMLPIKEAATRFRGILNPEDSLIELGEKIENCRGLGAWTSGYVRGHFFGDTDAVPLDDYHLPNLVNHYFRGRRTGTDDDMLELLEPYHGERFRVLMWLLKSGLGPPRRGPRLPHGSMLS